MSRQVKPCQKVKVHSRKTLGSFCAPVRYPLRYDRAFLLCHPGEIAGRHVVTLHRRPMNGRLLLLYS